jgi:predicted O-methyltransferase YrrM
MPPEKDFPLQQPMGTHALRRVLEAYRRHGYEVLLGNPDILVTKLAKAGRIIDLSAGLTLSDILVFQWIAEIKPWHRALVIGNAFGFSAFILASLCSECLVDAIDAEVEGIENCLGSELTRRIASEDFPGMSLTIGFSPRDLPNACRFNQYDFILIDGFHSNEQLIADFDAIRHLRSEECVVYCHDVGIARMLSGWQHIKSKLLGRDDEAFDLHFTSSGSTMVVRGVPSLKDLMKLCCRPLDEVYYYFGSRHVGFRTGLQMLSRTFKHSTRLEHYLKRLSLALFGERIFEGKIQG